MTFAPLGTSKKPVVTAISTPTLGVTSSSPDTFSGPDPYSIPRTSSRLKLTLRAGLIRRIPGSAGLNVAAGSLDVLKGFSVLAIESPVNACESAACAMPTT